jgi:hypothetical protein
MVKMNVDLLRVIQIGLTFSDENGEFTLRLHWFEHAVTALAGNFPADSPSTWQFHFAFRSPNKKIFGTAKR